MLACAVRASVEGVSDTTRIPLDPVVKYTCVALIVFFLAALVALGFARGDDHWDRLVFLLTGLEAVVFAGAGAFFGTTVQRGATEVARQDAAESKQQAAKERARADGAESHALAGRTLARAVLSEEFSAHTTAEGATAENETAEETTAENETANINAYAHIRDYMEQHPELAAELARRHDVTKHAFVRIPKHEEQLRVTAEDTSRNTPPKPELARLADLARALFPGSEGVLGSSGVSPPVVEDQRSEDQRFKSP